MPFGPPSILLWALICSKILLGPMVFRNTGDWDQFPLKYDRCGGYTLKSLAPALVTTRWLVLGVNATECGYRNPGSWMIVTGLDPYFNFSLERIARRRLNMLTVRFPWLATARNVPHTEKARPSGFDRLPRVK